MGRVLTPTPVEVLTTEARTKVVTTAVVTPEEEVILIKGKVNSE
jgi:hypothetical protein